MIKYGYSIAVDKENLLIKATTGPMQLDIQITLGNFRLKISQLHKVIPNVNWQVEEHFETTNFEIHIIPYGKGFINIEGEDFEVSGGQFYITGPNVKHSQISDKDNPMAEYNITLNIEEINSDLNEKEISDKEIAQLRKALSKVYKYAFNDAYGVTEKYEEIFSEVENHLPGYRFRIHLLVIDMVVTMVRTISAGRGYLHKSETLKNSLHIERINKIIKFIQHNYINHITVGDLANVLFLSPKQINRILKKEFNQTFQEYLSFQRFISAKRLVEETDLTVEEIAFKSGFSNANHLYQVFKKFSCPSPSKLRNLLSGGVDI